MMNLAVIFGGESCEHDISIITALQLIDRCNDNIYNIIPIYINKCGQWFTGNNLKDIDNYPNKIGKISECTLIPNCKNLYVKSLKKFKKKCLVDVAIVCLHGLRGEDGSVAGVLELSKIPYTSTSICGSAVCMDKCIFKDACKGMDVDTIDSIVIVESEYLTHKEECVKEIVELGLPIIIKPSRQGSSIGIEVCEDENEIDVNLRKAFQFDKKVLIEKFVNIKKEVNIALLKNKKEIIFSNTEEPISKDKILSFDEKYKKNSGGFETIKRIIPSTIDRESEQIIKDVSTKLYNNLELFGIVRFDYIIDEDDKIYVNEINTIPGSLANYLFDKEKYNYQTLIDIMVSNAIFRQNENDEVTKVFDSEVLKEGISGIKK